MESEGAARPSPAPVSAAGVPHAKTRVKNRFFRAIRRWLVFWVLVFPPSALVSRLPLSWGRWLARRLGALASVVARRERRLALTNLRHAFGDTLGDRELRRICRRSFQNAFMTVVETLVISRWSPERVDQVFRIGEGLHALDAASADGAVGVTAHFGNWEILAKFVECYHPGKLAASARKHSNPWIQRHIDRMRQRHGPETLYTDQSPRVFLQAIRKGQLLGVLPDQDLRTPNGIFVPFFGRPAYTTTLPANIARSTRCPMHVCLLAREGSGFRVILHANFNLPWTADRNADLARNTERMTQILEAEIRRRPEQWVWFHDRWKTRPGDEKLFASARWTRKKRR